MKTSDFNLRIHYPCCLVLFPTVGVSAVQRHQMTTVSRPNVKVLAVTGDFDDCQRMVKRMFEQKEFLAELRRRHNLRINTANSINWARLVPQVNMFYFTIIMLLRIHQHEKEVNSSVFAV